MLTFFAFVTGTPSPWGVDDESSIRVVNVMEDEPARRVASGDPPVLERHGLVLEEDVVVDDGSPHGLLARIPSR